MISYISLFLELLFDQFISKESFVFPLFTLISIFFLKRNKYFYIFLFVLGFIYDLFFTDLIFLHSILYILCGFIIKKFNNNIFLLLFIITIYQIILLFIYGINREYIIFIGSKYYLFNILYYYLLRIIYKK